MSIRHRLLLVALCLGYSTPANLAARPPQTAVTPPATGSALIIGRVVDATSNTPVSGAVVTLGGAGAARPASVIVDSQGRFVFADLPQGRFTIAAQKNGYVSGAYEKRRPDGVGQPIDLANGERVTGVTVRLWRLGSISGTVVDEDGQPVTRALVHAFARTFVAGRPSLSPPGSLRGTDDRGVYRADSLPPGDYVVVVSSRLVTFPMSFVEADRVARQAGDTALQARSAELAPTGGGRLGVPPGAASMRVGNLAVAGGPGAPLPVLTDRLSLFPITYYPSALSQEMAAVVVVEAGQHQTGIDFQLAHVPTVRVSGTAVGPNGPIPNLALHLQIGGRNDFRSRALIEPAITVTATSGAFTFLGVPAGQYSIVAQVAAAVNTQDLWASVPINVGDQDLRDVPIVLRPVPSVSGRVVFDGAATKPARLPTVQLVAEPADGHFPPGALPLTIDLQGRIAGRSLTPGEYFIRSTAPPPGWTLESAMVNGRDVADRPLVMDTADVGSLVVTFTDRPLTLSGTVRNAQGAGDPAATVLVFPTDSTMWIHSGVSPRRLRAVNTSSTGAFSLSGLPAGEYFAVAIPDGLAGQWQDPTRLERAARVATRVTVEGGTRAPIDLRTSQW